MHGFLVQSAKAERKAIALDKDLARLRQQQVGRHALAARWRQGQAWCTAPERASHDAGTERSCHKDALSGGPAAAPVC